MNKRDALLDAIVKHNGNDVSIPYWDIARLFPSNNPHPDSFEYKSVDQDALKKWATENGFIVSMLSEQAPENAQSSPPIRFRKIAIDAIH